MVIYDLQCSNQHQFEGWFKNADDLVSQQASGLLTCPFCNSSEVSKKLTAAKVGRKSNSVSSPAPVEPNSQAAQAMPSHDAKAYAQLQKMLSDVHQHIDSNFVDVGNKFADEALKIHNGEKDPENIRGTASKAELKELAEEGVSALPLPPKPINKDKLN